MTGGKASIALFEKHFIYPYAAMLCQNVLAHSAANYLVWERG